MGFRVGFSEGALRDLEQLYAYITEHDTTENADYVLTRIEEAVDSLVEFPNRGAFPKELLILGLREYRELFFKPYRIIYKVIGEVIRVDLIADGRRDMQSLLRRLLLAP